MWQNKASFWSQKKRRERVLWVVALCDNVFPSCTEGHCEKRGTSSGRVRIFTWGQHREARYWIILISFTVKLCLRIQILHRLGGGRNRYLGAPLLQAHYKSSVSSPDLDPVSSCTGNLQLKTLVTGKGEVTHSARQSGPIPISQQHEDNLYWISMILRGNWACRVLHEKQYAACCTLCQNETLRLTHDLETCLTCHSSSVHTTSSQSAVVRRFH